MDEDHPITETAEGDRETARFIALFLFGAILFSPLLIAIFGVPGATVLGIPLLYAYLFASWAVLIALAVWLTRQIMTPAAPQRSSPASEV